MKLLSSTSPPLKAVKTKEVAGVCKEPNNSLTGKLVTSVFEKGRLRPKPRGDALSWQPIAEWIPMSPFPGSGQIRGLANRLQLP